MGIALVGGRCGACRYLDVCGGSTRVRAIQPAGDAFRGPGVLSLGRGDRRRLPHLGSGIGWQQNGRRVMATPHLKEDAISIDVWNKIHGSEGTSH